MIINSNGTLFLIFHLLRESYGKEVVFLRMVHELNGDLIFIVRLIRYSNGEFFCLPHFPRILHEANG